MTARRRRAWAPTWVMIAACGADPSASVGDASTGNATSGEDVVTTDAGPSSADDDTDGSGTGGSAGVDGAGDGSDAGGTESGDAMPQPLPCAESELDQWEDITPPGVDFVQDFVLDPLHPGVVYLGGGQGFGMWRSSDCGATWTKINTGDGAADIDGGGHWTVAIDHVEPNVLYTANGYGAFGLYKSTNGGTDWYQIVDPTSLSALQFGGFVERVTVDPTDHQHLLVSPHFECENGHVDCFIESMDAGATWTIRDDQAPISEDSSQIMLDSQTWFVSGTDGLRRTGDGGQSWQVAHAGWVTDSFYRAPDGRLFTTALDQGVLVSTDDGVSWTAIPDSPRHRGLVGDGVYLYTSDRNASDTPYQPYHRAPLADPTTWEPYPSPDVLRGGWRLHYDDAHGILYSSTEDQGFWRVRTK